MKLERILQSQGFGSRKYCRALILDGRVTIGGEVLDDPMAEIDTAGLDFTVEGHSWRYRAQAYLMLHKPAGYECSRRPQVHPPVFALLPPQLAERDVQCVGRLDQDTTGLLLLSDDGQFIHQWSSGRKRTPKEYRVRLHEAPSDAFLETLRTGVQLHDEPAPIAAAACERIGEDLISLSITEGKYHQVKRMVAAAGNQVIGLHRCRIGGLSLPDDLAAGAWRWLEAEDLHRLAEHCGV